MRMTSALSAGKKASENDLYSDATLSVLCIRQTVLEAINEALLTGAYAIDGLATTMTVAARWEDKFGDPEMCKMHIEAFRDVVGSSLARASPLVTGDSSGQSIPSLVSDLSSPESVASFPDPPSPLPLDANCMDATSMGMPDPVIDPYLLASDQHVFYTWPQL